MTSRTTKKTKKERKVPGISNSFTEEEVKIMSSLLSILARGGDPSIVARQPGLRSFHSKIIRMKKKLEERKKN